MPNNKQRHPECTRPRMALFAVRRGGKTAAPAGFEIVQSEKLSGWS